MSLTSSRLALKKTLRFNKKNNIPFSKALVRDKTTKAVQKYTHSSMTNTTKSGRLHPPPPVPILKSIKEGWKRLPGELKMLKDEWKHNVEAQPMTEEWNQHGQYEVVWKFDKPSLVESWLVTKDADNDEGYSSANFTHTKNGTGLFHGHLDHRIPQTGTQRYAGYTNITAPPPRRSFNRESVMDWSNFNNLMLRIRGDGRPYMIILGCHHIFDVNWLRRWVFPMYTRGGPYWQTVKIPFSKFYLTNRGRIQDKQEKLKLAQMDSFGITCCGEGDGPYSLEIDSISLLYDMNTTDKHHYELYDVPFWELQN